MLEKNRIRELSKIVKDDDKFHRMINIIKDKR